MLRHGPAWSIDMHAYGTLLLNSIRTSSAPAGPWPSSRRYLCDILLFLAEHTSQHTGTAQLIRTSPSRESTHSCGHFRRTLATRPSAVRSRGAITLVPCSCSPAFRSSNPNHVFMCSAGQGNIVTAAASSMSIPSGKTDKQVHAQCCAVSSFLDGV